jgi:hypothetical protein
MDNLFNKSTDTLYICNAQNIEFNEVLAPDIFVFFSSSSNLTNHHHMMAEYLPCLLKIKQDIEKEFTIKQSIPIYFNSIHPHGENFLKRYLESYSLPFYFIKCETCLKVTPKIYTYYVNPAFNKSLQLNEDYFQFARQQIDKSLQHNKKLLILRQGPEMRQFSEKDIDKIKSYGYEVHNISNYTIKQQADLFFSATNIILAHGAACTNLIFCRDNTKIIEINPGYNPFCYPRFNEKFKQKTAINIDYRIVFSDSYYQFLSLDGHKENYRIKIENGQYMYINNMRNILTHKRKSVRNIDFNFERIENIL